MNDTIKKIIVGIIAGGSVVAGGNAIVDKANCEYVIPYQGKEICIDQEVKEAISSQLKENSGFGGISFGKKE